MYELVIYFEGPIAFVPVMPLAHACGACRRTGPRKQTWRSGAARGALDPLVFQHGRYELTRDN